MTAIKAIAGNIYCVYNDALKKYTACQIIKIDEMANGQAVQLILDWSGDKPMTADEMAGVKPLYMDYFYWQRGFHLVNVKAEVPLNYIFIGNKEPLSHESTDAYGFWDNGYNAYRQFKWEQISEAKRQLFKAAAHSEKYILWNSQELPLKSSSLNDMQHPFEKAKSLLELPCLSKLSCERWYDDLEDYLEACPFLMELQLRNHGQESLDFRKSHLQRLTLSLQGVNRLYLNEDLQELTIIGESSGICRIFVNGQGEALQLHCHEEIPFYSDLKNLRALQVSGIDRMDMKSLAENYPNLKSLRLWGRPGNIDNFAAVADLKKMQQFSTMDLFGFGAEDIPNPDKMKDLSWFWMTSLPEEAAKKIKSLYKKSKADGLDLNISKPRKKEWLAQNLDNPFRSWEGESHIAASTARKAATIYRKTRGEVLKLIEREGLEVEISLSAAIKDYTEAFNKMDTRYSFIETEERENIYEALWAIVDLVPEAMASREKLIAVFEKTRDF